MGQKAQLGAITAKELLTYVCREVHYPEDDTERFEQEFFSGDRVDYDLIAYIRSLKVNYRTGIISNAWDDVRLMITGRWQMADAFDQIILSAEEKLGKPDARIFQLALERLQVAPEEAVFIDDFLKNIAGAQMAGMQAIHFRSTQQVRIDLDQLLKKS